MSGDGVVLSPAAAARRRMRGVSAAGIGGAQELKLCEAGCNKTFLRPASVSAKVGPKMCPSCRLLTAEQRELQFLRVRGIGQRARQGGW